MLCFVFPSSVSISGFGLGVMIGSAREDGGLYYFEAHPSHRQAQQSSVEPHSCPEDIMLVHRRLGHPSLSYLKLMFPSLFKNKSIVELSCDVCQYVKHHRTSFSSHSYKASALFVLVHSDVWGPFKIPTNSGKKWFVTFIDDHTRMSWVYLLGEKSEVDTIFKTFFFMVQTQFQKTIKVLRSDNGKEYFNHILGDFLQTQGIIHQSSCVRTPQQNGVAESKKSSSP
ncbi:Beta-galactosidase [Dorcoceras hygrometricum]|nr:Beta-galactosidase [Dorcoceras hygrometricum]